MKGLLIVFALSIVGLNANVIRSQSRIASGVDASAGSLYACIVLVVNDAEYGAGNALLGGGSIISVRHVLTTASLVSGKGNTYQIGYRTKGGKSFQRVDASFIIENGDYDPVTLENDIALIVLPPGSKQFPTQCIVSLASTTAPPASGIAGTVVAYGFTAPTDTAVSQTAFSAAQTVGAATDCKANSTQFCARGTTSILCPGDAGSGLVVASSSLYADPTTTIKPDPTTQKPPGPTTKPPGTTVAPGPTSALVGLVSKLTNIDCKTPASTVFTNVGLYEAWIKTVANLPLSQAVTFVEIY